LSGNTPDDKQLVIPNENVSRLSKMPLRCMVNRITKWRVIPTLVRGPENFVTSKKIDDTGHLI
jgi:hypothetical protein